MYIYCAADRQALNVFLLSHALSYLQVKFVPARYLQSPSDGLAGVVLPYDYGSLIIPCSPRHSLTMATFCMLRTLCLLNPDTSSAGNASNERTRSLNFQQEDANACARLRPPLTAGSANEDFWSGACQATWTLTLTRTFFRLLNDETPMAGSSLPRSHGRLCLHHGQPGSSITRHPKLLFRVQLYFILLSTVQVSGLGAFHRTIP